MALNSRVLEFDGVRSDTPELGISFWTAWDRPIMPETKNYTLEIPGMDGAYDLGRDFKPLEITCKFVIQGQTPEELREYARKVSGWLGVKGLKRLIFGDEPDKFYMARVTELSEQDRIYATGICQVTFFCPDPYAYSVDETLISFTDGEAVVENTSTAAAFPKIVAEFEQPASFFAVVSPEKHMLVGDPAPTEQTPIPERQPYLHDDCSDLGSWNTPASVEVGTVAGSIATDGKKFFPSEFGTGTGWHGPALVRDIPDWSDLQDFQVDFDVMLNNLDQVIGKNIGRIIFTLLTSTNEPVCSIDFQDPWIATERNIVDARVGSRVDGRWIWRFTDGPWNLEGFVGRWMWQRQAKQWSFWGGKCARMVDSSYYTNLKRIVQYYLDHKAEYTAGYTLEDWAKWNNIISPYNLSLGDIVYFPDNHFGYRRTVAMNDSAGKYQAKPAKVMIQFLQYQTYAVSKMEIKDISIYKLNKPGAYEQPVYHFNSGDRLEIDTQYHNVLLNGKPYMQGWDIGSDFFSLPTGVTPLNIMTDGEASTKIMFRERWS